MKINFEIVILTSTEKKLLKKLKKQKPMKIDSSELRPDGLLQMVDEIYSGYDSEGYGIRTGMYIINETGLRYLQYLKNNSYRDFIEFIPNWVSMLIALAALGLSIWSLYLQFYG